MNMNIDAMLASGPVAATRGDADSPAHRGAANAPYWRNWGVPVSVAIHGAALVTLWLVHAAPTPPAPKHAIEITLAPPPAPLQAAQPVAQAAPVPAPPEPVRHVPSPHPRAAPVTHAAPVLSTPATTPAHDVAPAPTAAPTPAPSAAAAPPAPPAPPTPPAPRVIGNASMPSDYVNTVFSRINAHVRYPGSARRAGVEGTVAYTLTLSPSGELLNVSIKSSGDEALDDAALDSIHAAAPFGALPDLGGTTYRLTGAIAFALR